MGKKKRGKKKTAKLFQFIFFLGLMICVAVGLKAYKIYQDVNSVNVKLVGDKNAYIYIPTSAVFDDVKKILYSNDYLHDTAAFEWVAKHKKYINKIKAGRYKLTNDMNNNQLVNMLRSGKQTPVKLIFNKIRTKERFASEISKQIEADSNDLFVLLNDKKFLNTFDKTPNTALCMFIPNTYELYWNTNANAFVKRMQKEYKRFWNKNRTAKSKDIELSPDEVYILASIVEEETTKNDEKRAIAGVYINRLKRGMRLQADPTVKFAVGNFGIKRILNKHLECDSPYNTYMYAGLPPGPICIPSIASIDAVLNYEKHKYLYFCAKDDFSGYHVFARTLSQHNANARRYRRALNKHRIYR